MKILFTKNVDPNYISEKIGSHISIETTEVIKTNSISVENFDLKEYSLIFTSSNGVKAFFENGFFPQEKNTATNYNKIYCVGEKAKRELQKKGCKTFKSLSNVDNLSQFILKNGVGETFIHFCGNLALDVLARELSLESIEYKKVTVYHTEELNPTIHEKYHAIVFFSPSGVRSFAKNNSLEDTLLFSIGETTSKELKKYTESEVFTSKENTLLNLLSVIKNKLREDIV